MDSIRGRQPISHDTGAGAPVRGGSQGAGQGPGVGTEVADDHVQHMRSGRDAEGPEGELCLRKRVGALAWYQEGLSPHSLSLRGGEQRALRAASKPDPLGLPCGGLGKLPTSHAGKRPLGTREVVHEEGGCLCPAFISSPKDMCKRAGPGARALLHCSAPHASVPVTHGRSQQVWCWGSPGAQGLR